MVNMAQVNSANFRSRPLYFQVGLQFCNEFTNYFFIPQSKQEKAKIVIIAGLKTSKKY